MRKDIWDRYLLKLYYDSKLGFKHQIPFEFLYEDELDSVYKSIGFALFRLRYSIALFISNVGKSLKE